MSTGPSTASVSGGGGFTGGELLRSLAGHPAFTSDRATSRQFTNGSIGVGFEATVGLDFPGRHPMGTPRP